MVEFGHLWAEHFSSRAHLAFERYRAYPISMNRSKKAAIKSQSYGMSRLSVLHCLFDQKWWIFSVALVAALYALVLAWRRALMINRTILAFVIALGSFGVWLMRKSS